ncbi:MAG: tetratricopeptide repeat protein [Methanosarcinaceae archaeon]
MVDADIDKYENYLNLAAIAFKKKDDIANAKSIMKTCLSEYPNGIKAYVLMGEILHKEGGHKDKIIGLMNKAENLCREAVAWEEELNLSDNVRAQIYYLRGFYYAVRESIDKDNYRRAEKDIDRAIAILPNYGAARKIKQHIAEKRSESGGCFVATAAFNSAFAEEVKALSSFRDEHLIRYGFGRFFVSVYYLISPPIAIIVQRLSLIKWMVRFVLAPIIIVVRKIQIR